MSLSRCNSQRWQKTHTEAAKVAVGAATRLGATAKVSHGIEKSGIGVGWSEI